MNAVELVGVSKRFHLRSEKRPALQDTLIGLVRRRRSELEGAWSGEFWALRDVNLRIAAGETLGVIGPNGAGKTTILKLIARTLEPTSGSVTVHGDVAAILGLGIGFHPDLSGRENVYLYGSFLGIAPDRIGQQIDAIVEFSGLGRFFEEPIKHYSSGMYARLAFAAVAMIDADIVLLDEIFAVGDEEFHRKCVERMYEMQRSGRTIVLVTHGLDLVARFCTRAVWIGDGHVQADGEPAHVVAAYRAWAHEQAAVASAPAG